MATQARQFFAAPGLPGLPGAGLPHDRLARLAARRVFVDLKATFMAAVASLPGPQGSWLRVQVRGAEEPVDLWLLRAAVLQALNQHDAAQREVAQDVLDEAQQAHKGRVVTELQALANWWPAEDYHQHYFARNPGQGYCAFVVAPKVEKFKKTFRARLRA